MMPRRVSDAEVVAAAGAGSGEELELDAVVGLAASSCSSRILT